MSDYTFFSTGELRVGAVAATLDTTNATINVQNVTFPFSLQEALVKTASWLDLYATADAQFDAAAMLSWDMTNFPEEFIPWVMGISAVTSGGKRTYTATKTSKCVYCQTEFVGQTTAGKQVRINIPCAKIKEFNPQFSRQDFQKQSMQASTYPNGTGGPYAPFIIAVDV